MARNFQDYTSIPFFSQIECGESPVVLVNTFVVPPEKVEEFEAYWKVDATFMKAQPGMLAAQIHKGVSGNSVYVNVAHWESATLLAKAFKSEEFQNGMKSMPAGVVVHPLLTKKMAVSGICTE